MRAVLQRLAADAVAQGLNASSYRFATLHTAHSPQRMAATSLRRHTNLGGNGRTHAELHTSLRCPVMQNYRTQEMAGNISTQ